MGEFSVRGKNAEEYVNKLVTNDVGRIVDGQCQYSPMCYENGTIVDDLIIYKNDKKDYLLVVNAGNIQKDWDWANKNLIPGVELKNLSDETAEVALQGPKAEAILQKLADADLKAIRKFRFSRMRVAGLDALVSRTGYTGEDGFEIYVKSGVVAGLWNAIIEGGKGVVKPVGLGARDTLRLEAAMMLYGNDIDDTTTPLEAGLAWTVKLDKRNFNGRKVLAKQAEEGLKRKLVGFRMAAGGIARHGYDVLIGGKKAGRVTSGTFSPTLKAAIGLAYVPAENAGIGSRFDVMIRDRPTEALVVQTPFIQKR
jgi:aminomethyltransferase